MPFVSKKQVGKCYALKSKGAAGTWNCDEWADKTNFDKLPEEKKSSVRDMVRYCWFLGQTVPNHQLPLFKISQSLQHGVALPQALHAAYPKGLPSETLKTAGSMIAGLAEKQAEAKKRNLKLATALVRMIRDR